MGEGGFIYTIGTRGAWRVKIGWTAGDVYKRCAGLQTGHPTPLRVLACLQGEADAARIEAAMHGLLAQGHLGGEWFALEAPISQPWSLNF